MVLQAYLDESIDPDGTFVLAGYIATAESWAQFSGEWEKLLKPFGTLGPDGKYRFKMTEMIENAERMARVPIFAKCIGDHVLGCLSSKINVADLRRAQARIKARGVSVDWSWRGNPYHTAFWGLMDLLHQHMHETAVPWLSAEEKIDFYFDNRSEKTAILRVWDSYISTRATGALRARYGATPRFEDDSEFLPLQAADFWAWWLRKWYSEGTPEKIPKSDFGSFTFVGKKDFLHLVAELKEDHITNNLKNALRARVIPGTLILDSKYFFH
jgi:hypothetical protein